MSYNAATHAATPIMLEELYDNEAQNSSDGSRGFYIANSAFDTNIVIIVLTLLCLLICAMGLNSIVRCALRTSAPAELYDSVDDVETARVGNTGMRRKVLRALPTVVYGAAGTKLPGTDCPICLAEFVEGEEVRILPKCNHGFHVRCIDMWLSSNSSCPTCRQNLLDLSRGNNNEGNMIMNVSAHSASPSTAAALRVPEN